MSYDQPPQPNGTHGAPEVSAYGETLYALFHAALAVEPERRGELLDQQCQPGAAMRAVVEQLLRNDARAREQGFLADPPSLGSVAEQPTEATAPSLLGFRLGPYELLQKIGSGGMGSVYRAARVEDFTQEVAVKIVHARGDSEELVRRLHTERQVLARLQHPHIARLLDGGTGPGGFPYLVMEYIDGPSIDRHCEAQRLSIRERVQLVVSVCDAVAFAHTHDIVHRDIKPGNVLLDASGAPRLTDFGLAKDIQGGNEHTPTGHILGTPAYMAPERTRGESPLDEKRADIYSLGALLYRLITDRAPFVGSSWHETLNQVLTQEPLLPRNLVPNLALDLEAICLEAMAKDPRDRYASAQDLADDLRRYLGGEQVRARPVGRVTLCRRWCRRNPVIAGLGVSLAAALLLGFVGVTASWQVASQRASALEEKEVETQRQRDRAEAKEKLARQAVTEITRVAQRVLASQPGMQLAQRDILEKALALYQQIAAEPDASADVRFEAAQAHHYVGVIQQRLGRPADAERHFRDQIALLERLAEECPQEPRYRFDLFFSHLVLTAVLHDQHRRQEADRTSTTAFAMIERLVEDFPDEANYRDALAAQCLNEGERCLAMRADSQGAERLYTRGLTLAEELVRAYPEKRTEPHYRHNLALALGQLGHLQVSKGDNGQALEFYSRAISETRRLCTDHPASATYQLELSQMQLKFGDLLVQRGATGEAEPILREALDRQQTLSRRFPDLSSHRHVAAAIQVTLGRLYMEQGKAESAERMYRAYAESLEGFVRDFTSLPDSKERLAGFLATCPVPSIRNGARALALAERTKWSETNPREHARIIGIARYHTGDWPGCIAALSKCIPDRGPGAVDVAYYLAMSHHQAGERDQARKYLDLAREWSKQPEQWHEQRGLIRAETDRVFGIASPLGKGR